MKFKHTIPPLCLLYPEITLDLESVYVQAKERKLRFTVDFDVLKKENRLEYRRQVCRWGALDTLVIPCEGNDLECEYCNYSIFNKK